MIELCLLGIVLAVLFMVGSAKNWAITSALGWAVAIIVLLFLFFASNRKDAQG